MCKKKKKKSSQTKEKKKKMMRPVTSLSKKGTSCNWLAYMKSKGWNSKLYSDCEIIKNKEETVNNTKPIMTKVVALDCEMVSDLNDEDMLARVSIVNYNLKCIYDKYVKPSAQVGDYRTRFSGIREKDLEKGEDFETVQREVKNLIYNKILVGHAIGNDFKVLKFGHHKQLIRDTSKYEVFRECSDTKSPSLRKLAKVFLDENIQEGEHDSVEDARTAMKLYKKFKREWEISLNSALQKKEVIL